MQSCRTSSWLLQIPFAPKGGHIGPRLHVARGKIRVREIVFLLFAALCLTTLIIIPGSAGKATAVVSPAEATGIAAAGAPVLLTQANSTRGIALDSVTELAEPFQPQTRLPLEVIDERG